MFDGPTERCSFCRSMYYLDKLREHEVTCSARPRRLTAGEAVRIAVGSNRAASTNTALLVRLVWQIKDGYWSEPPRDRLTDPESIVKELRLRQKVSVPTVQRRESKLSSER